MINLFINNIEPQITSARGRLTDRLIAQGLLTPGMLSELRREWDTQQQTLAYKNSQKEVASDSNTDSESDSEGDNDEFGHKKIRRKRKK